MDRIRSSSPALAILLALFCLALYLLTGAADLLHNGDTDLRYQTTQAIVDAHRLWLASPMFTDSRVARGLGGHLYAFYGPGQVLLMIPLYVAGKAIAHHLQLPYDTTTLYACRSLDLFLGAGEVVAFFWLALLAGYRRRIAALLAIIFGVATVVWPDAQSALEQTQVTLCLLLAVACLWRGLDSRNSARWIALCGAAIGAAVLTRYDMLLYLPVLAGALALVRWRRGPTEAIVRQLAVFGLAAAPFLLAVAAWNMARFGSPFTTGLHQDTLGNPFFAGLAELLVSPGKGLIWYLPVVFLLPFAAPAFVRRAPSLALLCAALVLVPLVFYANVLYWHGDPAWGPRYLYVAVPYLILPLGELLAAWRRRPAIVRTIALVTVAGGVLLSIVAVSVTGWRFWYHLEAIQQSSSNEATWSGQPFRWGAQHYHYYWRPNLSPLRFQVEDVYQVARIAMGDRAYLLSGKPDPFISGDTAANYPVNTLNFWWADVRHPLLGNRTRYVLAGGLGAVALASLCLLLLALREPRRRPLPTIEETRITAGVAG